MLRLRYSRIIIIVIIIVITLDIMTYKRLTVSDLRHLQTCSSHLCDGKTLRRVRHTSVTSRPFGHTSVTSRFFVYTLDLSQLCDSFTLSIIIVMISQVGVTSDANLSPQVDIVILQADVISQADIILQADARTRLTRPCVFNVLFHDSTG